MKLSKEHKYNLLIIVSIYLLYDLGDFILNYDKGVSYFFNLYYFKITFLLSCISIYALNYLIVLPKFFEKKQFLWVVISFILFTPIFSGIRFLLEEVILFQITHTNNYYLDAPGILKVHLLDSFYYTLIVFILSSITYFLFRHFERKEQIHQLQTQHQEAQMAVLKSQISPHFLFNTLNSFYVDLYDTQPETAADILKLSNLLRYVIYETEDDFIALDKEIDFIKNYLHFFKRRYEDNFFVDLNITGNVNAKQVPSMILIHFIENVCKHGIINQKDRAATIDINVSENSLKIQTKNAINHSDKHHENGIGTDNIKKRLSVLFGTNYELEKTASNSIFEVSLKFPLN